MTSVNTLTNDTTQYVVMNDVVMGPEQQRGNVTMRFPHAYVCEGHLEERRKRAQEVARALNVGQPIPDGLRVQFAPARK